MRRISIDQLRTGDRIGRDICTNPAEPALLRAGTHVSDGYRQSLRRAGIATVWIDDGLSRGIEPLELLSEKTKHLATVALRDAFRDISEALVDRRGMTADTAQQVTKVADLICEDVTANTDSALALNDLANAEGYTAKHSLAVTALGLSLGLRVMRRYGWIDAQGARRFDGIDQQLSVLGVGLLLLDIGKLAVPSEIFHKRGPLTADEWMAMRAHPALGEEILQQDSGISPLSRAVVLSHHERWDGAGYPSCTAGADIHQFARIAAVADVFDALTSDRPHCRALPVHEGYERIIRDSGLAFDPEVVEVFRWSVAAYPPGTGVLLSDRRWGIVKEVRQGTAARPVVRIVMDAAGVLIPQEELDLERAPGISIVSTAFEPSEAAPASTDPDVEQTDGARVRRSLEPL
jgi:HD-GYP domain-containing protein (c-di-GMP phosphodiesterase class II)